MEMSFVICWFSYLMVFIYVVVLVVRLWLDYLG